MTKALFIPNEVIVRACQTYPGEEDHGLAARVAFELGVWTGEHRTGDQYPEPPAELPESHHEDWRCGFSTATCT